MKRHFYFISIMACFAFTFLACVHNENYAYKYNYRPTFSWGYAEFFGPYYSPYDVENNVVSLSLFTDSLKVDSTGNLAGYGQYLFFENIFIRPTDFFLPDSVYQSANTYGTFTFTPGANVKIDSLTYSTGAYILFVEKESARSVRRYVKEGTMTVKTIDNVQSINCHLILDNDSVVDSKFSSSLVYYNESGYNIFSSMRPHKVKSPIK